MCEYRGVKPRCVMKVTVVGILHNPPASILRENGLSVSIHVGTRNFPQDSCNRFQFYQVKRMIRGSGSVMLSAYSQTLNG